MNLQGRTLVLGVAGGIAAYKAADLASRLRKAGAELRVTMTRAATRFVAPLTFETIAGHRVYSDLFDPAEAYRMEHIEWARWAEALLFAPATSDLIARLAHGQAEEAPLALYLAFRGPTLLAPAMNTAMWEHPATQANVHTLTARGVALVGPAAGPLACGEIGEGRMAEPAEIMSALEALLAGAARPGGLSAGQLAGRRVLITAGPTREALDPIRFISNRSSGRMAVALAAAALRRGARVTVVHGPMAAALPPEAESVPAESAEAMLKAVQGRLADCDVAVFAAAVANYRPAAPAAGKIKAGERLTLELVRNPDIAGWAGHHRNGARPYLVGFAAESENLLEAAREKLAEKNLDLIVANPIGLPGVGFEAEANAVTLLSRTGEAVDSGRMGKDQVADWLWDRILERVPGKQPLETT